MPYPFSSLPRRTIRLVHGFHRETSLQSMIEDGYNCHEKVLRIQPGDNSRIIILVLKELN